MLFIGLSSLLVECVWVDQGEIDEILIISGINCGVKFY